MTLPMGGVKVKESESRGAVEGARAVVRAPVTGNKGLNWVEVVRLCRRGARHIRQPVQVSATEGIMEAEGQQVCKDGFEVPSSRARKRKGEVRGVRLRRGAEGRDVSAWGI